MKKTITDHIKKTIPILVILFTYPSIVCAQAIPPRNVASYEDDRENHFYAGFLTGFTTISCNVNCKQFQLSPSDSLPSGGVLLGLLSGYKMDYITVEGTIKGMIGFNYDGKSERPFSLAILKIGLDCMPKIDLPRNCDLFAIIGIACNHAWVNKTHSSNAPVGDWHFAPRLGIGASVEGEFDRYAIKLFFEVPSWFQENEKLIVGNSFLLDISGSFIFR